jgi:thymidylate synthase
VDNDVHIWDSWAYQKYLKTCNYVGKPYTQEEFISKIKSEPEFAKDWGDLGEGTYGGMWRNFPCIDPDKIDYDYVPEDNVDQIQKVLDKLKNNPDDRRMIVSAWHPYWSEKCALPPCHCFMQFNTEELTCTERYDYANNALKLSDSPEFFEVKTDEEIMTWMDLLNIPKRRLNLLMYQRSLDAPIGGPFNLTSYSLLLAMVAQCVNMVTGVFTWTMGDVHIYRNQMDGVDLQMGRTPKLLPKLWLNPSVTNLFDFKYEDIKLIGYDSHPAIKMPVAV